MNHGDNPREIVSDSSHPRFAKRREAVLSWALAFFLGTVSWLLIQDAIRVEKAALETAGRKPISAKAEPSVLSATRVSNVPILVLGSGEGSWRVDPPFGVAVLEGEAEELSRVDIRGLRMFVDVSGLSPSGRYEVPVRIYIPGFSGVLVTRADPSHVFLEPLSRALSSEAPLR